MNHLSARPSFQNISIIIPTYNRHEKLLSALDGYKRQTLNSANFELVIVDDGSDVSVNETVNPDDYPFNIQLYQERHRGASRSKNKGLLKAKHEIILFTGDDMMPEPGFLENHLKSHCEYPDHQVAILGYIKWDDRLKINALMNYVTEVGEQQFSFNCLQDGDETSFWRFYTSNISLKKQYIDQSKQLFDEKFTGCGFEDIEFGYRLAQWHQLKIIYSPRAIMSHDHPMDLASCYQREFHVGEMQVLFDRLHPNIFKENAKIEVQQENATVHSVIPASFLDLDRKIEQLAKKSKLEDAKLLRDYQHEFFAYVIQFARNQGIQSALTNTPY